MTKTPEISTPSNSWVIIKKETGEVVVETFDKSLIDKLNTEQYYAMDVYDYLVSLNKKIKQESS